METKDYPQPKWKIGQKVIWEPRNTPYVYDGKDGEVIIQSDFDFWCRQYLRHIVKFNRRIQNYGDKRNEKIRTHIKDRIRHSMEILRNSWGKEVEIAGIIAIDGFNVDSEQFNQCYVAGVAGASSPVSYHYQICIRWDQEAKEIYPNEKEKRINTLAMITGIGVGTDGSFVEIPK